MKKLKQFLARRCPPLLNFLRWVHRKSWRFLPMEYVFTKTYEHGGWGCAESVSGKGSSYAETKIIREQLPVLFRELGIKSVLDIPCGDFHWMKEVAPAVEKYIGADVVKDLVATNNRRYRSDHVEFVFADAVRGPLPRADVILCRDMLVHFPFREIQRALKTFQASGAEYLLATTFTERETNADIEIADWRPLNLQRPPFSLPPPVRLIVEGCASKPDKSLALWRLADLNV